MPEAESVCTNRHPETTMIAPMSTISAIILTANRRRLLEKALGALDAGTRRPDEVVVVNNRSTDDTTEFLTRARFSFRLTVIDGPEGTFTECRNAGVRAASGEWVAFLDDDCEADRWWLERLVGTAESNGWVAAGGAVLPASQLPSPRWYSPGLAWTLGCHTPMFFGELGGRLEIPTTSNLLFRRDLIEEFPFRAITEDKASLTWNYEYSREDAQFWRELRRAGKPVGVVPRALVWHHVPARRMDREYVRERARQDGRGFWNRERLRDEVRPAVRDVVYTPIGAVEDVIRSSVPLRQAWENRKIWAGRQLAFLEYAVDDMTHGIAPSTRLGNYLLEGGRAAGSLAKSAARQCFGLGYGAWRPDQPIPTVEKPPRRLLVVLHDLLGDAVLSLPMLRQLGEGFPDTDITLLTGPVAGPMLVENCPDRFNVLITPPGARGENPKSAWKLWKFLEDIAPDAVLLAYCHGIHPGPLFFLDGAPVIGWPEDNGISQKTWADILAVRIPKAFHKHEAAAILDLLAPFGIATRLERPRVVPSGKAGEKSLKLLSRARVEPGAFATIHLEGDGRGKFWPVDRFFQLADDLHEHGYSVFLVGSREGKIVTETERRNRPWCHSVQGLLDSDELGALIRQGRLFVGCDSGPAHLAQAVGTPTLVLFGDTDFHRWSPLSRLDGEGVPPFATASAAPGDWLIEERRGLPRAHAMNLLDFHVVRGAVHSLLQQTENLVREEERH